MAQATAKLLAAGVLFMTCTASVARALTFEETFSGSLKSQWRWLDEDPGAWNLNGGRLNIRRYPGNGFFGNARVPVLYYPSVPFVNGVVARVKVGFDVDRKYGQAGLVAFYNNDNYAKLVLEYWWENGLRVIFLEEVGGVKQDGNVRSGSDNQPWERIEVELKFAIENGTFRTWFRRPGDATWTDGCTSSPIPANGPLHIGLFSQADMGSSDWAWFDDFGLTIPGTAAQGNQAPMHVSASDGTPRAVVRLDGRQVFAVPDNRRASGVLIRQQARVAVSGAARLRIAD